MARADSLVVVALNSLVNRWFKSERNVFRPDLIEKFSYARKCNSGMSTADGLAVQTVNLQLVRRWYGPRVNCFSL